MHELGIAEAVAERAIEQAAGRRVTRIGVRIGRLQRVEPEALEMGVRLAGMGSTVADAVLDVEEVPVTARCHDCQQVSTVPDLPLRCASCGSLDLDLLTGEELQVDYVEVDEAEAVSD
jgi:hydrogenase nickel incorporation protein HypA/HybF